MEKSQPIRPLDPDVAISWTDRETANAATAQAALDLAERARAAGEAEAARYAGVRGWFSIGLGLAMGAVTPVACGVRSQVVIAVVFTLYALVIAGMSIAMLRMRGSTAQGWTKRYLTAFIPSVVIYSVSVAVAQALKVGTWVHWIPAGVAVALPLVILGVTELRRGRAARGEQR